MKVKLSEILIPPPYRFDPGNMEELKQTLQRYGMIHPVVVKQISEETIPRFELIAGYRRLKAAESLGWTEIPVTVLQPKDSLDQFDLAMEENMKRKEFNPLEISELLIRRKRLWEKNYGLIEHGKLSPHVESSDNSSPNGEDFYEQAGRIFKRHPKEIYKFLQLQELDEDLKAKLEAGEIHYRKAIEEQSRRKNPEPKARIKKCKRGVLLPNVPQDVLDLEHDVQNVVWQLGGLNQAMRVLDGMEYSLDVLAEDHIVVIIATCATLMDDIARFNAKLQDTLLQKTGMSLENQ